MQPIIYKSNEYQQYYLYNTQNTYSCVYCINIFVYLLLIKLSVPLLKCYYEDNISMCYTLIIKRNVLGHEI